MNLKEQLQLLKGIDVKVGFNTSFVYCDMVGENTESELTELSKEEFIHLNEYRKQLQDHLKRFDTFWFDKINNYVKKLHEKLEIALKRKSEKLESEALKNKEKLDLKKYEAELKKIKKQFAKDEIELREKLEIEKVTDYQTTSRKIVSYTKRIETFTPFLDRKVIEVYDSTYNDGTKIIRCEGLENGNYWFKEEYLRAKLQRV